MRLVFTKRCHRDGLAHGRHAVGVEGLEDLGILQDLVQLTGERSRFFFGEGEAGQAGHVLDSLDSDSGHGLLVNYIRSCP